MKPSRDKVAQMKQSLDFEAALEKAIEHVRSDGFWDERECGARNFLLDAPGGNRKGNRGGDGGEVSPIKPFPSLTAQHNADDAGYAGDDVPQRPESETDDLRPVVP